MAYVCHELLCCESGLCMQCYNDTTSGDEVKNKTRYSRDCYCVQPQQGRFSVPTLRGVYYTVTKVPSKKKKGTSLRPHVTRGQHLAPQCTHQYQDTECRTRVILLECPRRRKRISHPATRRKMHVGQESTNCSPLKWVPTMCQLRYWGFYVHFV